MDDTEISQETIRFKSCRRACEELETSCPCEDCRLWIDYDDDLNCTYVAISKHGDMRLREVAERLHFTPARISQLEKKAVNHIRPMLE